MKINKKSTPKKTKKTKAENIYSINNQEFRFPSIIDRIMGLFK
jgi:division protein CdvB (Snf7/Vps24/ESCRT-III family)